MKNNLEKEENILKNRLRELAGMSYHRGIPVFSDFLNLNEQNLFKNDYLNMPPVSIEALGGYNLAERNLIGFIPEDFNNEVSVPISTIYIRPLNAKFSEELNHRDFLGSIMNLGIERSKIGDIIVNEKDAYLFCVEKMAGFIIDNLTRIKHTPVICSMGSFDEEVTLRFTEIQGSISSVRLDSVLALCFGSSRSGTISNIEEGRVFVNGKIITTNSYVLHENDIISVRGLGKFKYVGINATTKKGRHLVTIQKYI